MFLFLSPRYIYPHILCNYKDFCLVQTIKYIALINRAIYTFCFWSYFKPLIDYHLSENFFFKLLLNCSVLKFVYVLFFLFNPTVSLVVSSVDQMQNNLIPLLGISCPLMYSTFQSFKHNICSYPILYYNTESLTLLIYGHSCTIDTVHAVYLIVTVKMDQLY